ncbi:hypothetical protein OsJ_08144 [Oryza sativa Japonica Group]|uniref:Uncharacterized protein n=2 Tax=Oryza TaxID=4527 RepID=A3AAQ1_ORYSJ|nr:hypothetical protein OsJ_08144 [Oryza sativa Japonica Group]
MAGLGVVDPTTMVLGAHIDGNGTESYGSRWWWALGATDLGHVFQKQWIKDGRPRSTPLSLSPNLAFWAAHRLHGTHPMEIDFLDLGLQGMG